MWVKQIKRCRDKDIHQFTGQELAFRKEDQQRNNNSRVTGIGVTSKRYKKLKYNPNPQNNKLRL